MASPFLVWESRADGEPAIFACRIHSRICLSKEGLWKMTSCLGTWAATFLAEGGHWNLGRGLETVPPRVETPPWLRGVPRHGFARPHNLSLKTACLRNAESPCILCKSDPYHPKNTASPSGLAHPKPYVRSRVHRTGRLGRVRGLSPDRFSVCREAWAWADCATGATGTRASGASEY